MDTGIIVLQSALTHFKFNSYKFNFKKITKKMIHEKKVTYLPPRKRKLGKRNEFITSLRIKSNVCTN